jgi:uncharacterized LabA/DUF88 family protein
VAAYVDGFNLYYGLKSASRDADREWVRNGGDPVHCLGKWLYWLDLRSAIGSVVGGREELVSIKYFSAPRKVPRATEGVDLAAIESSNARQRLYWDAIRAHSMVSIIEGVYLEKDPYVCTCGKSQTRWEEKMTDVNLALHMQADAFQNRFDLALLLSADSDFVPVVRSVRGLGKRVKTILFPGRKRASDLRSCSDSVVDFKIKRLRGHRLPDRILRNDLGLDPLDCPAEWKVPHGWCWDEPMPSRSSA